MIVKLLVPLHPFNGFQKKSQKTPQDEIEKAIKIKEAYYEFIRRKRDA